MHRKNDSRRRGARGRAGLKRGKHQRKDKQFCAQVLEAVQWAISEVYDDDLSSLYVLECNPAPNVARIEVSVEAPFGSDLARVSEKLAGMTAYFRAEISDSIHRKKVPDLYFVVVPREEP